MTDVFLGMPPTWRWERTLALAPRGSRSRIADVVFGSVRHRCSELGLRRGDELRLLDTDERSVTVERPDGSPVVLERDYAWFIQLEPV